MATTETGRKTVNTYDRTESNRGNARWRSGALVGAGVLLVGLVLSGCEGLLDVERPTRVEAEALDDPALAQVLVNSAIADFECAFSNYTAATALLTDELMISTEFIAPSNWDLRRITSDNGNLGTAGCNAFGFGVWQPLQTARWQAEQAFEKIEGYPDAEVPNKTELLATAAAYEGYSLTLIGEGFCQATVNVGPALQPEEVLGMAEERFTEAIDLAGSAGVSDILNMARVGRARVRNNLGDATGAATDAEQVQEGFVKTATYSSASERRENTVFLYNRRLVMVSVDPDFRNLEVQGVPDPRVPVTDAGRVGHDGVTSLWFQDLYTDAGSPIPIATWDEAQLIIAESKGGQEAVDAINRLRDKAGLPEFESNDSQEIRDQIIEERRRELWLQSHRLNDKLRFDLPFATGTNHKGQPYGSTTCLPLPDAESKNNPNVG